VALDVLADKVVIRNENSLSS